MSEYKSFDNFDASHIFSIEKFMETVGLLTGGNCISINVENE